MFFFTDPAPTEIYTLSLHDALPICCGGSPSIALAVFLAVPKSSSPFTSRAAPAVISPVDRKSTRLNSSHLGISYAVFCLKKKKMQTPRRTYETHSATQPHSYLSAEV